MTDPTLVFAEDGSDALRVVINFGMYAGRDATAAEIERLGESLLPHAEALDVVAETRTRFDRERAASVYQVRVELPAEAAKSRDAVVAAAEEWARECLADRRLLTP